MNKDTKQRFDVDPILEKISPHIPDDEIDLLFPFRNSNTQGRLRAFIKIFQNTPQLCWGDEWPTRPPGGRG